MAWSNPTPTADASLVKGAAIAALVYRGLALLLFGLFASIFTSLFFSLASLPTDNYGTTGLPSGLSAGLAVVILVLLVILGAPVALSIWMLVAAHRGRPGQVLAALILYSAPFGIALITGIATVVLSDDNPVLPGLAPNSVIGILPEAAILIVGWLGWWRMRRPPAPPAPIQSPYQVQQPIPYTPPAQQYAPTPYQGPPQTPQLPPWQGRGSPWQGPPGRMG